MKKQKHLGFDAPFIDEEEAEITGALNRGEFQEAITPSKALKKWQSALRNTLRKRPITIRVQERDIAGLKAVAIKRGIPYQTLVASVLHQFVSGKLKENS
jgi:predicted DNA binding CopG/RHH family protein